MSRSRGFTLVELMITLLVAALLLGIGVPAFGSFVEQGRLTTTTNQFLTTLHLVRSEAVRRGHLVSLCTSVDGRICAATAGWHQGWILYTNPDRNLQPPNPDSILRIGDAWTAQAVSVQGNTPVRQYIHYNGPGRSEQLSGALLMGTITICAQGDRGRAIVISSNGRPRVAAADCPG